MVRRDHLRSTAMMIATLAVAVGLASCGSSDAGGATIPSTPAVTQPATTATPTTTPPATTAPTPPATEVTTRTGGVTVTDAEVADLEKQLDEIDQLLAGVDADLSQD